LASNPQLETEALPPPTKPYFDLAEIRSAPPVRTGPDRPLAAVPDAAGDYLNAGRFLAEFGHLVRRAPELGRWFIWNGSNWEEDRLERVLDMATGTIDQLRDWVAEADGVDELKRRTAHYAASSRAGRRDSLLAIAGTDPNVVVAVNQLDTHQYLLACRNGTVDLRSGQLRPARREDLITRGVAVDYDPDADPSEWLKFITTIFQSDTDLIDFVQRLLGYCLSGAIHEHVLPVVYGLGANGKSTLLKVMQGLMGDHAMTAPEGLIIRRDHEPHPERIAALRGRRLVVSNELEANATLAEQTVKMLTGGDTLSARELYGRRFNFEPTHKMVVVSNHKPRVHGTDDAIWRRVRLIPFTMTIPTDQQEPDLARRLIDEHGPAVLAWLVRGAVTWSADGLGSAPAVDAATEEYRSESDTFGGFLAECTVEVPTATCRFGDLWDRWRQWCDRAGERPGRTQDFRAALEDHGLNIESYQGAKTVRGLGIVVSDQERFDQEELEIGEGP
jgi:putative DNA primase/helicase